MLANQCLFCQNTLTRMKTDNSVFASLRHKFFSFISCRHSRLCFCSDIWWMTKRQVISILMINTCPRGLRSSWSYHALFSYMRQQLTLVIIQSV
jgi:hypothetical protein